MRKLDAVEDPWGFNSPSVEQSLADDNLRTQDALWSSLEKARIDARRSFDDVAECLHLSVDVVQAIAAGRMNISLSDLREYAYAVDALVGYRVTSRYTENLETHRRLIADTSSQPWHELPGADDEEASVKRRVEALSHER